MRRWPSARPATARQHPPLIADAAGGITQLAVAQVTQIAQGRERLQHAQGFVDRRLERHDLDHRVPHRLERADRLFELLLQVGRQLQGLDRVGQVAGLRQDFVLQQDQAFGPLMGGRQIVGLGIDSLPNLDQALQRGPGCGGVAAAADQVLLDRDQFIGGPAGRGDFGATVAR